MTLITSLAAIATTILLLRVIMLPPGGPFLASWPRVLGPTVSVSSKAAPARCVFCHDGGLEFICRCGAAYHRECWNELGKCATLGCNRTKVQTDQEIRDQAYRLWLEHQSNPNQFEDWVRAERLVLSQTHGHLVPIRERR